MTREVPYIGLCPQQTSDAIETPEQSEVARALARSAALLFLLGLTTGLVAGLGMTGKIPIDGRTALSAHLNAMLGAGWMVAVAWSVPRLRYGKTGLQRLTWLLLVANFGNWLVTFTKACLHTSGLQFTGVLANDAVFVALNVVVVVPSLAAAAAWWWGLGKPAGTQSPS